MGEFEIGSWQLMSGFDHEMVEELQLLVLLLGKYQDRFFIEDVVNDRAYVFVGAKVIGNATTDPGIIFKMSHK